MTLMNAGGELKEVDTTSCKSLSDLEQILKIIFGESVLNSNELGYTKEEYNVASSILCYFWWLNNTEEKRSSAILRGKNYIDSGGHNFSLFIALIFFKTLKDDEVKFQVLKYTAVNGKYLSEKSISSLSHQDLEDAVLLLLGLSFDKETTGYLHFLIHHDGEEIDLVNLPNEINQLVW